MARQRPSYLNLLQLVGILIIAVVLISHYLNYYNRLSIIINNNLQLAQSSAGKYKGHGWHNPERTISVSTISETSFARCDLHTVKSEDGSSVINDWLFLEEVNAVNIIVQTLKGQKFVVFEQQKYAIPGNTLSPVGGFIDENESPLTAAKREVLEELGVGSRQTLSMIRENYVAGYRKIFHDDVESIAKIIFDNATVTDPPIRDDYGLLIDGRQSDPDWIYLGRYRTAANRGGGFIYSYLLKNAIPLLKDGGQTNYNGAVGDLETQKILHLSEVEVMEALSNGRFQEVKWAATLALAMLHIKHGMPSCCDNG